MLKKYSLLAFAVLFVFSALLSNSVYAQDDEDLYTYKLHIPAKDDYCNCDADCRSSDDDYDGCLTAQSSRFLKELNSAAMAYVGNANEEGYNGVCARLFFANQQTPYQMTKDCDPQFESKPKVESSPAPEPEPKIIEDSMDDVIGAISGMITKIEDSSSDSKIVNKNKEVDTMEVSSAQLIALTVIVIGFFGLMGWIAYLLQK